MADAAHKKCEEDRDKEREEKKEEQEKKNERAGPPERVQNVGGHPFQLWKEILIGENASDANRFPEPLAMIDNSPVRGLSVSNICGTGGFEAHGLAKICEQAYPFPATEPAVDREVTKRELREWLDHRMAEAAHRGTLAGGKYPHLCFLVDMLLELEPESRFIHIDRPLDESIRSLTDRSEKARGWLRATPEQCERLQRALDAAKRDALAKVSPDRVLTIRYHDLLVDPSAQVDRVVDFLGLNVREEQRRAAISLVQPERKQH